MSLNERGLGRGLDALFRNAATQPQYLEQEKDVAQNAGASNVSKMPVTALSPARGQPRVKFDEAALQELADSIRSQGIVQPLLVRPIKTGSMTSYEIIAGERRWRAARLAGLDEVPVFIREMSDEDALTAALIENLQREDLNPMEEAIAIQALRDRLSENQDDLAKRLGKSRSAVSNTLRLLNLPEPMREALRNGTITPGHARTLLSLPDEELQNLLFEAILQNQWAVRDAEAAVLYWRQHGVLPPEIMEKHPPEHQKKRTEKPEIIKTMIQHLRSTLHPKANISGTENMGRVTVPYESQEQLAKILELLSAIPASHSEATQDTKKA